MIIYTSELIPNRVAGEINRGYNLEQAGEKSAGEFWKSMSPQVYSMAHIPFVKSNPSCEPTFDK